MESVTRLVKTGLSVLVSQALAHWMLLLHRWSQLYVEVVALLLVLGPWWPRRVGVRREVLPFVGRDPALRQWPCFASLALVALLVRAVRQEHCRRVRR